MIRHVNKLLILSAIVFSLHFSIAQPVYEYSGEIQIGPGIDRFSLFSASVFSTHGARINNVFIGAGMGFKDVFSKDNMIVTIPLYARVRYCYGNTFVQPMLMLDVGTPLSFWNAIFFEPSVGFFVLRNRTNTIFATLGLNFQKNVSGLYYKKDKPEEKATGMLGTLNFRIGMIF